MVTDPCWQHRPLLDRYLNTHRVDARVVSAAGLAVEDGPMKQPAAASSLSAWKSWVSGCPEGGSGCPGQRLDELLVASLEEVLVDS